MNAGQGARPIVMSCEAPADERDCELGRFLVLFQFKDFHLLQRVTREEVFKEDTKQVFTGGIQPHKVPMTFSSNSFRFFFMYVHILPNDM